MANVLPYLKTADDENTVVILSLIVMISQFPRTFVVVIQESILNKFPCEECSFSAFPFFPSTQRCESISQPRSTSTFFFLFYVNPFFFRSFLKTFMKDLVLIKHNRDYNLSQISVLRNVKKRFTKWSRLGFSCKV